MFGRKKIATVVAEVVGVFTLTLVVYSMLARTTFPLFSGLAAGLTLATMYLVVGNLTDAHLNPAVTIGMWVMRKTDTIMAIVYIAAQILGAVLAWALMYYFLGHRLTNMAGTKFDMHVLIAEAVGTAVFTFSLMAAALKELEPSKFAFIVGGSFALGVMVASLASNGILNPAVALGIRSFDWSYALGPILGAVVGSSLYALLYSASNVTTATRRQE